MLLDLYAPHSIVRFFICWNVQNYEKVDGTILEKRGVISYQIFGCNNKA